MSKTREDLIQCAIYLDNIKQYSTKTVELGCGHTYHSFCVFEWLKINETCPLCRNNLLKEEEEEEENEKHRNVALINTYNRKDFAWVVFGIVFYIMLLLSQCSFFLSHDYWKG
jgi:hypothetical protein